MFQNQEYLARNLQDWKMYINSRINITKNSKMQL